MGENKLIRAAVIDDGINERLYNIGCLDFNIEINHEFKICKRKDYNNNLSSHGTTCAAIIKKYAPDVRLGSIKILNDVRKRAERYQLITAIDWCIQNGVKLVNLSLGTIDFRDFDEIRYCVNMAAENGLIIISACNNKNTYTVPSCLTNVIGVRCRKTYIDAQYKFIPYSFDGIDVEASGRHLLADIYGKCMYTRPFNSFAAPFVTAMVHKILSGNPDALLEEIKEELHRNATDLNNNIYNPYICMNTDWFDESMEFDESIGCFYRSVCYSVRENRKLWNPEFYAMHIHKGINSTFSRQIHVDIPVIAVYDNENNNVLNKLNMFFLALGYYSVKISTDYMDTMSRSEYLPEGIRIEKFIAQVYKKYCCDIILLRTNNDINIKLVEKNTIFDIILYIIGNEEYYNCNKDKSNLPVVLTLRKKEVDKQIEEVFKMMLELLEGKIDNNETKA